MPPEIRLYKIAFKCWPDLLNANDFVCEGADLYIYAIRIYVSIRGAILLLPQSDMRPDCVITHSNTYYYQFD